MKRTLRAATGLRGFAPGAPAPLPASDGFGQEPAKNLPRRQGCRRSQSVALRIWDLGLIVPVGCAALLLLARPARAQDTVAIPKSRLEELERKERELDRLKGDVSQTKAENAQLKEKLQQVPT